MTLTHDPSASPATPTHPTRMAKILGEVQEAELELAHQLVVLADKHVAEGDLYHQAHSQARQCAARVERLTPWVEIHGAPQKDTTDADRPGPMESVRRKAASLVGKAPTAPMLFDDLRDTYLFAVQNQLNWLLLAHVAEALRDHALFEVVMESHERAEACMKWLRTRLLHGVAQVMLTP